MRSNAEAEVSTFGAFALPDTTHLFCKHSPSCYGCMSPGTVLSSCDACYQSDPISGVYHSALDAQERSFADGVQVCCVRLSKRAERVWGMAAGSPSISPSTLTSHVSPFCCPILLFAAGPVNIVAGCIRHGCIVNMDVHCAAP
jgi:hypothetical protein